MPENNISTKSTIYHAPGIVLDPFKTLLKSEGIYLEKIILSDIGEIKSDESLKILS